MQSFDGMEQRRVLLMVHPQSCVLLMVHPQFSLPELLVPQLSRIAGRFIAMATCE